MLESLKITFSFQYTTITDRTVIILFSGTDLFKLMHEKYQPAILFVSLFMKYHLLVRRKRPVAKDSNMNNTSQTRMHLLRFDLV